MRKIIVGIAIALVIGLALVFLIAKPGNSTNTARKPVPKKAMTQQENNVNDVGLTQEEVEQGLDLQNNGANGTYIVNLLSGSIEGEVKGKILSDTDCTPDKNGISRCHNEIELDNQKKVTVVTPHNMDKNRCLRSGESVRLSIDKEGKVIVKLLKI